MKIYRSVSNGPRYFVSFWQRHTPHGIVLAIVDIVGDIIEISMDFVEGAFLNDEVMGLVKRHVAGRRV